jgi:hypothetical protein
LGAAQQIRTLNLPGQKMLQSSVSVTGEFSPNPYLKNMISTYRKDFPLKNDPNLPDFKKITNRQIFIISSSK